MKVARTSCPYCRECRTVLNGRREGKQIYRCRGCGKQFREGGAIGGHSFPPDQIGAAIQMCYTGWSLRKAAKALKDQFGIQDADVTPTTIRNWVDSYTDAAIRLVRDLKVPGDGLSLLIGPALSVNLFRNMFSRVSLSRHTANASLSSCDARSGLSISIGSCWGSPISEMQESSALDSWDMKASGLFESRGTGVPDFGVVSGGGWVSAGIAVGIGALVGAGVSTGAAVGV